jgi:hypothetical protein
MIWALIPPGKEPLLPIGKETEWAQEPVWMKWQRENLSPCYDETHPSSKYKY